ncbi:flagellar biosynthetic protein FliO [Paenibacillus gansuensis]|uniref:Flagellar biosynthetic protein FliO n=1 Tax=Paenibacillus gansuensis TaxID=306542 RepID=A0ABW5PDH0_9BACL
MRIALQAYLLATNTGLRENEPLPDDLAAPDPNLFGNFFRVIFVLVLIVGLIVLLIRYLGQKNRGWMVNRSIKTLGGIPLGQHKSIQLVEIGSSIYVVGVGEDIRLLEKIQDPEEVEHILSSFRNPAGFNGNAAASALSDWIGSWKRKKPQQDEELEASFQDVFYQKMQQLPSRKKMVEDMLQEEKNNDRSSET